MQLCNRHCWPFDVLTISISPIFTVFDCRKGHVARDQWVCGWWESWPQWGNRETLQWQQSELKLCLSLPAHWTLPLRLQGSEHDDDRVVPGRSFDEATELVPIHPDDRAARGPLHHLVNLLREKVLKLQGQKRHDSIYESCVPILRVHTYLDAHKSGTSPLALLSADCIKILDFSCMKNESTSLKFDEVPTSPWPTSVHYYRLAALKVYRRRDSWIVCYSEYILYVYTHTRARVQMDTQEPVARKYLNWHALFDLHIYVLSNNNRQIQPFGAFFFCQFDL